jgi:hypothetical protein
MHTIASPLLKNLPTTGTELVSPRASPRLPPGDEREAAVRIQAIYRGRELRKGLSMGTVVRQAQILNKAKLHFKQLAPLEGHYFHGGFPGAPIHPSLQLALSAAPADASCYERSRDAMLNFFLTYQRFFLAVAALFVFAFVIDICVIIFAFWG